MATALANRRPALRLVEHPEPYMADNDKPEQATERTTEPFTQIPNALLEAITLHAKGLAELKIILAIARKTLGYLKRSDIISYSQFEEMTGLARSQLKSAIDRAIKSGAIERTEMPGKTFQYVLLVGKTYYSECNQYGKPTNFGRENLPELVGKTYTQKKDLNKEINSTTPNGVVAPPAETEIEIQEEITPDPSPDKKVTDPTTPALFAVPGKNGHGEPGQVGSQKPKKKPEVKERDPTLDHFAVVAWHEMVVTVSEGRDGAWPNPVQRKLIASNVPDTPEDRERWGKVLSYWARHNYQMRNIPQLLDVFFNGNGNGKKPGKT